MAEKKKRVGPFKFITEVRQEANKVTWTSRQETITATVMVLIMVTIVAIFLFLVDSLWGFIIPTLQGIR